ncbi:MAG TPA: hypothetical protein VNU44_15770, partial [Bryobacteraceae bacterium]|jgi:hypothetical protein|nr:hypothetical protein [Bryobacteraceae bacterium]
MPGPPIPASFESLRQRPFSFYPPIVNVEHNEWILRRADWTDFRVINTKTKTELCVPRRFVGEGALVEEPVMIVGLVKELEYREGEVLPHVRRVIEMPRAVNDGAKPRVAMGPPRSAPVVGIRIEAEPRSRVWRLLVAAVAAAVLLCVAVVIFVQSVVIPHKHAVSKRR